MTSPALSSARAAGPFAEIPTTTTLFSISVENIPSQGRAGLLTRTEFAQIVEHRLEQIDRHDHVDVLGLAPALALELQRADAEQFRRGSRSRGAAPIGMRRIGEDCLVQQILPVTAVLLLGGRCGWRPSACARRRRRPPRGRRFWHRAEEPSGSGSRSIRPSACTRPKPLTESKPSAWPFHHAGRRRDAARPLRPR